MARRWLGVAMLLMGQMVRPAMAGEEGTWLNAPLPTMGGKQFWADLVHFHKWRIQRSVLTGHCRLLDGDNVRRAWGSYEGCFEELQRIKREERLAPMRGKVVISLHGLVRTRSAMAGLCEHLEENGDYTVLNVSYPSTRADLAAHAEQLAHVIEHLGDEVEQIDFIAHSLGNLVIRRYLAEATDEATGKKPDPRIGRIVMIAPPNQGSAMAKRMADQGWFKSGFGPCARQLACEWDEVAPTLATPKCQFGILAGGQGFAKAINPLLDGENDLVVTVEETKLPGAHDFAVLPFGHTFLMDQDQTKSHVLNFLRHGYFVSEDERKPIER